MKSIWLTVKSAQAMFKVQTNDSNGKNKHDIASGYRARCQNPPLFPCFNKLQTGLKLVSSCCCFVDEGLHRLNKNKQKELDFRLFVLWSPRRFEADLNQLVRQLFQCLKP